MARLRERNTGSTVNVPDDQVDLVLGLGYYERADEPRQPAKKAAPRKKTR
jgi:hypothetical protein